MKGFLPRRTIADLLACRPGPPSQDVQERAEAIVGEVRNDGEAALRRFATDLDGLARGAPLFLDRSRLEAAEAELPTGDRDRLRRIAGRIQHFADAQREALGEVEVALPGGRAGHRLQPLNAAGCYAPAGAHPLPSSVLMTVIPARVAGVRDVWVASPRPLPILLAAASIAGADGFVAAGGAQAIAALAFGAGPLPAADIVVGPGNAWVTAAKRAIAGEVRIDGLAGPSELLVLAEEGADREAICREILAQAEHAEDAWVGLVTTDAALLDAVDRRLPALLETLPTAAVIRSSLVHGGASRVGSTAEAVAVAEALAPEHLLVVGRDLEKRCREIRCAGTVFEGSRSSVAFGDYGAGPNHTLPTGGAARGRGGLSVLDFLAVRTWLKVDPRQDRLLLEDTAWLARQEGLEAHARAAEGAARERRQATGPGACAAIPR